MTIKETLNSLRARAKARITPESSEEQVEEYNSIIAELDAIEKEHNDVVALNGRYKSTIVDMVLNQGDSKTPVDESEGSKPKSIDELLADFQAKQEKDK